MPDDAVSQLTLPFGLTKDTDCFEYQPLRVLVRRLKTSFQPMKSMVIKNLNRGAE